MKLANPLSRIGKIKNYFQESRQNRIKGVIFGFVAALLVFYLYLIVGLYLTAQHLRSLVPEAKAALYVRDWDKLNILMDSVEADLNKAQNYVQAFVPFTFISPFSNEVAAFADMAAAVDIGLDSGRKTVAWAREVKIIAGGAGRAFSSLSEAERRELLQQIADAAPLWQDLNQDAVRSQELLNQAINKTRLPFVEEKLVSGTALLRTAQELGVKAGPWLSVLPEAFGYPEPKTYLVLLQNNAELRPTGGFIGTYGILTFENGAIKTFTTDNVYNLDEPAKAYNTIAPPEPLKRYLKQSQWFLRDANWNPDFALAAEKALELYQNQRGPIRNFAGVIALTPPLVEELIRLTGPVIIDDKLFAAENLIDTLAYHVEAGFAADGLSLAERKRIIDDIAQELKTRVFNLSIVDLGEFAPRVLTLLKEKHLLFYFRDQPAQTMVEQANWAGRIRPADGDYAYVVDANLGSLKSDPVVKRHINYTLRPAANGQMEAKLSIKYNHTGQFDWKTTRYRTYTRVYAPLGAKFSRAQGNEEPVAIYDESGKTVFGTFITIEPGTSETLEFTYTLPMSLVDRFTTGNKYSLLFQKQPGAAAHGLKVEIFLPWGAKLNRDLKLAEDRLLEVK